MFFLIKNFFQLIDADNGLTEDELTKSTDTLSKVCEKLDADYLRLNGNTQNEQKCSALFLIRKKAHTEDFKEIRVAVLGKVYGTHRIM